MTTVDMITRGRWVVLAELRDSANALDKVFGGMRNDLSVKDKNKADSNEPDRSSRLRLPPELANRIELHRSDFMSCIG